MKTIDTVRDFQTKRLGTIIRPQPGEPHEAWAFSTRAAFAHPTGRCTSFRGSSRKVTIRASDTHASASTAMCRSCRAHRRRARAARSIRSRRGRRRGLVLNEMSRYHLALDALRFIPRLRWEAERARDILTAKLHEHHVYIREHLEDMPEIRNWHWTPDFCDPAQPPPLAKGHPRAALFSDS